MKKFMLSAVFVMAFSKMFASSDVKEAVLEKITFLGTHEECKGIMDNIEPGTKEFDLHLQYYHICRNSTVLPPIEIEVPAPGYED